MRYEVDTYKEDLVNEYLGWGDIYFDEDTEEFNIEYQNSEGWGHLKNTVDLDYQIISENRGDEVSLIRLRPLS